MFPLLLLENAHCRRHTVSASALWCEKATSGSTEHQSVAERVTSVATCTASLPAPSHTERRRRQRPCLAWRHHQPRHGPGQSMLPILWGPAGLYPAGINSSCVARQPPTAADGLAIHLEPREELAGATPHPTQFDFCYHGAHRLAVMVGCCKLHVVAAGTTSAPLTVCGDLSIELCSVARMCQAPLLLLQLSTGPQYLTIWRFQFLHRGLRGPSTVP
jgi:hypothetical protein